MGLRIKQLGTCKFKKMTSRTNALLCTFYIVECETALLGLPDIQETWHYLSTL